MHSTDISPGLRVVARSEAQARDETALTRAAEALRECQNRLNNAARTAADRHTASTIDIVAQQVAGCHQTIQASQAAMALRHAREA